MNGLNNIKIYLESVSFFILGLIFIFKPLTFPKLCIAILNYILGKLKYDYRFQISRFQTFRGKAVFIMMGVGMLCFGVVNLSFL